MDTEKNKKRKKKYFLMLISIFLIGVLLIFSAYAWFSTSLNVRVKTFNMIVTKNSGLTISFDAINYDSFVEISEDMLINKLKETYPNNTSQWSGNGLIPVSTAGISNPNTHIFDIFWSEGVIYKNSRVRENGWVRTTLTDESYRRSVNRYIAFDVFLKNVTGSPIDDNLYFDTDSQITIDGEISEEMMGLINSIRIGLVKVGSAPLKTSYQEVQNITCNNNCESIIFEPYSKQHTDLSIERAQKYGLELVNGERFPTYAYIKEANKMQVADTISGSPKLDMNYFKLQETITEEDFDKPLFQIPNGVTKVRIYVWLEGQDIDSLETDSEGADIDISISFVKDTAGYTSN